MTNYIPKNKEAAKLKYLNKSKETKLMYKSVVDWIDNALDGKVVPDNIVAFCFNLYEEDDDSWAMELVGTERFDPEDEDWACDEVTDFGTREHMYNWEMECEWDEALDHMVNELKLYLTSGKYAELLKSKNGVGVGFVDGNIEIIFSR